MSTRLIDRAKSVVLAPCRAAHDGRTLDPTWCCRQLPVARGNNIDLLMPIFSNDYSPPSQWHIPSADNATGPVAALAQHRDLLSLVQGALNERRFRSGCWIDRRN
jgi:hypothetical protein